MQVLRAGASIFVAFFLAGCGSLRAGPDLPVANLEALDTATDWIVVQKKYAEAAGNPEKQVRVRNSYISNATAAIDIRFLKYLRSLSVGRSAMQAAAQESILALSIAGTLIDGLTAKTNIAAAIALISGSQAIVDEVYFANQTTDAIAAQMVAGRREAFVAVLTAIQAPSSLGDLDASRAMVLAYQAAGSFKRAVAQIHQDATVREAAATLKIQGLTVVRNTPMNVSPENVKLKQDMVRSLRDLTRLSPEQVSEVLIDIGVPLAGIPNDLKPRAELLQFHIQRADTDRRVVEIKDAMVEKKFLP